MLVPQIKVDYLCFWYDGTEKSSSDLIYLDFGEDDLRQFKMEMILQTVSAQDNISCSLGELLSYIYIHIYVYMCVYLLPPNHSRLVHAI